MKIIEISALENGAHNNQTINGVDPEKFHVPDGWAIIHERLAIPETFPFVNIEAAEIDGVMTVTSITAGIVPDPEPETDPEPTEADDTAAMLVDHEYRLTMLELGLTE